MKNTKYYRETQMLKNKGRIIYAWKIKLDEQWVKFLKYNEVILGILKLSFNDQSAFYFWQITLF